MKEFVSETNENKVTVLADCIYYLKLCYQVLLVCLLKNLRLARNIGGESSVTLSDTWLPHDRKQYQFFKDQMVKDERYTDTQSQTLAIVEALNTTSSCSACIDYNVIQPSLGYS